MPEEKLTIKDICRLERCHPNTVRRWIENGCFPHAYQMSQGGGWKIPVSDYETYVKIRQLNAQERDAAQSVALPALETRPMIRRQSKGFVREW